MAKNITVVVRSVGERTEKKCIEYLKNIFGEENVFSVKNVTPFSKAVKETFKIGIKRKKKWTLAIDADVFLFKNEIFKFIEAADKFFKKNPKSYCFEGKLFDKFSQIYREVGCHLYNTKMLKKAVKYADGGYLDNRPETYIKQKMTDKGYGFYVCQYNIGIHDFFQFPHSIVKKAILHCKKHADINDWIQKWKELAERDTDFSYALKGYEIYNSLNDKTIIVDVNFMNNLTQSFNLEQFNQTKELTNEEIDETLKLYNKNDNKEIEFILCFPMKQEPSLTEKIFSLKNTYKNNKKYKVITILGLQLKIRKKTKLDSQRNKIKILVCYHKKDKLFKNDVLVPIHCGRALACEESKDGKMSEKDYQWMLDNMIGDDTGDNISKLNRDVNEMSAIYWAWKNYDKLDNPDYIGLCHYRRLFDFSDVIKNRNNFLLNRLVLNENDLNKLLSKYDFVYRQGFKITDNTKHTFEPYQSNVELSEKYHPLLFKQYQNFKDEQIFYCGNMFIMKKEDFFNYCEDVFPLMFDFLNEPKDEVNNNFLNWAKINLPAERYNKIKEKSELNNNWYPRMTGYMMEYISSFYFMHLIEIYKDKALSGHIYTPTNERKAKLLDTIFSVKNKTINSKRYKVITVAGLKIKIRKK